MHQHWVDPVALTETLLSFDTTNPPGQEGSCATYLARLLSDGGFSVQIDEFEHGRANVLAHLPGTTSDRPLVLSGHLDTVPVGSNSWRHPPFGAVKRDGKLYGRGASDMKSGVAAIVAAALQLAQEGGLRNGLSLVLTAGEEVGCAGAASLVGRGLQPTQASALLIAEPTSNRPVIAHKGALYMHAHTKGVAAHSSMPHLGVNAVYKAARAITKVEEYSFREKHDLLGYPTINVGMISGGKNVNSVSDAAQFTIDVRSIPGQTHPEVLKHLREYLGPDVEIEPFVDMPPVASDPHHHFVQCVLDVVAEREGKPVMAGGIPFFTDASVLQPAMRCPTIILGPGEPSMAHQTDEFCYVDHIPAAVNMIVNIARSWDRSFAEPMK